MPLESDKITTARSRRVSAVSHTARTDSAAERRVEVDRHRGGEYAGAETGQYGFQVHSQRGRRSDENTGEGRRGKADCVRENAGK